MWDLLQRFSNPDAYDDNHDDAKMLTMTGIKAIVINTATIAGTNDVVALVLLTSALLCTETLRFGMMPPAEMCNTGDR